MFSCWDIYRFAILSRVRIARQTKKAVMDFSDAAGGGGGVRGGGRSRSVVSTIAGGTSSRIDVLFLI